MNEITTRSIYSDLFRTIWIAITQPKSFIENQKKSIRTAIIIYFHMMILYTIINIYYVDFIIIQFTNQIESVNFLIEYSPILKFYFSNYLFLGLMFITLHLALIPITFSIFALLYKLIFKIELKLILSSYFVYAAFIPVIYIIPNLFIVYLILSIVISSKINQVLRPGGKVFNGIFILQTILHVIGLVLLLYMLNQ